MPRPHRRCSHAAKATPWMQRSWLKFGVFDFPIADFKVKNDMRVAALGLHDLRDYDDDDDGRSVGRSVGGPHRKHYKHSQLRQV